MRDAFIQANYIEAILDRRTLRQVTPVLRSLIEVVIVAALALLAASGSRKSALAIIALFATVQMAALIWPNLAGIEFDLIFPTAAVLVYMAVRRIIEWHRAATAYERRSAGSE
jgi:CHASE2 domain-containing sensor protein